MSLKSLFLLGLVLCVSGGPQSHAADDFSAVERLVDRVKSVSGLPSGTAIAVIRGDDIIYEAYFGYSDIKAKNPVDANTSFYIGSITKPLFSLSALLKENKGKISERQTLQAMFPKMAFEGFDAHAITLKDLLGHTSGLDYKAFTLATAYTGIHTADSRHRLVAALKPVESKQHGTFAYTNGGYNVASVWFDDLFNQPWQKTLAQEVFAPLGLKQTSAYISDAAKHGFDLAKTYSFTRPDRENLFTPLYLAKKDNTMHAAGGVITTARELATFLIAQINGGRVGGEQIFPDHVIAKSHQQLAKTNDSYKVDNATGYGWGWAIGALKGERLLSHGGGFAGVRAHASFMPDQKLGLVILNAEDTVSGRLTDALTELIYSILLGTEDISEKERDLTKSLTDDIAMLERLYREHYENLARRKMDLTLEKQRYVGRYSHPIMGSVDIQLNEDKAFIVRFGNMRALATAYKKPDSLRVELNPGRGEGLVFQLNEGGVTGLSVWGFNFDRVPQ